MARKLNKAVAVYLSLLHQASDAGPISRNIAQKACHGAAGVMISPESSMESVDFRIVPIRQLILDDLYEMEVSA